MRKLLLGMGLLVGAVLGAAIGFGANIPSVPITPNFSEPSQIVNTINTLVQSLQGGVNQITPTVGNYGIGAFCTNAAGASPQTCNGQRGAVAFTGLGVTTTGTVMTTVINDTNITAGSQCSTWWSTAFTAGSAVTVATMVPAAGTLTVISVNAGTTANAVTTGTLGFDCIN